MQSLIDAEALKSFRFDVGSVDQLDELNTVSRMPLQFSTIENGSFDVSINGSKRDTFAVWRTVSKSGFTTRPTEFEDIVTIRFPLGGSVTQSNSGEDYSHTFGQAVLIPFPEMQGMVTSANVETINCTISREALFRLHRLLYGDEIGKHNVFTPLVAASSVQMQALLKALLHLNQRREELLPANDLYHTFLEEMLIFQVLSCWPRALFEPPPVEPVYGRTLRVALDYIEAHLANPMTVSEIAAAAGVSVRSLQSAFRKGLGQTPLSYIIDQRLERVHRDLFEERTGFIAQIAHRWGFYNIADFTRRYRMKYGVTPTITRRGYLGTL